MGRGLLWGLSVVGADLVWVASVAVGIACAASFLARGGSTLTVVVSAAPALGAVLAGVVAGAVHATHGSSPWAAAASRWMSPTNAVVLGMSALPVLIGWDSPGALTATAQALLVAWLLGVASLGGACAAVTLLVVRAVYSE